MKSSEWQLFKAALIFVALMLIAMVCIEIIGNAEATTYTTYTVEQGDTLWSIAKQSNLYNGENTREIIAQICEASDCTTVLRVGQQLSIPQN